MKTLSALGIGAALLATTPRAEAAEAWTIYDDATQNDWQPWGWAKEIDYSNTQVVHSGQSSIAVKLGPWEAIYIHHAPFDTSRFDSLSLWINGGAQGRQNLRVIGVLNDQQQDVGIQLTDLTPNTWMNYVVSLKTLRVDNRSDMTGLWLLNASANPLPVFYLDDLAFAPPDAAPEQ